MQKHVARVLQLLYPGDYKSSAMQAIKVQLEQEEKEVGKRFRSHRRYYALNFLQSKDIDPKYMLMSGILHDTSLLENLGRNSTPYFNQCLECLYDSIETFIAQTYRNRLEGVINAEQLASAIIYAMNDVSNQNNLNNLCGYAFSRHPFGDIRANLVGNTSYIAYAHTHFVVPSTIPTLTQRVVDFYEQFISFVDGDTVIFNTFNPYPYNASYVKDDAVRACDMGNGKLLVSGHTSWITEVGKAYELTEPVKVKVIPHKHSLININTRLQTIA